MSTVKPGIIGPGRLGPEHAKNIHSNIPGAELAMVCSIVDAEPERAAGMFPDASRRKEIRCRRTRHYECDSECAARFR